jgi:hypothetical protein
MAGQGTVAFVGSDSSHRYSFGLQVHNRCVSRVQGSSVEPVNFFIR